MERNVNSETGTNNSFQFGGPTFKPVVGDWDGNGTTTVGLYEPTAGQWVDRNVNSETGTNNSSSSAARSSRRLRRLGWQRERNGRAD